MKALVIFAPNVKSAGGLRLLQGVLKAIQGDYQVHGYFAESTRGSLVIPMAVEVEWVPDGVLSRVKAELALHHWSKTASILMFNSLPPLFPVKNKVMCFVQNRLIIDRKVSADFRFRGRVRIFIEALLLRLFSSRLALCVVQTETMKSQLEQFLLTAVSGAAKPTIRVCPFIDFSVSDGPRVKSGLSTEFDFFYPADGAPHKNHKNLFRAWRLLGGRGVKPTLAITLSDGDVELLDNVRVLREEGIKIINLGRLSSSEVAEAYLRSRAVIFPSLVESFGMPLVEAEIQKIPILASDLDFVYDVCDPAYTFNANDPASISRAVSKFLGLSILKRPTCSTSEFLDIVSQHQVVDR